MFVCLGCGGIFSEPKHWYETHGLSTPPYEEFSGSPCCSDAYTEAYTCSHCGDYITTENYIKINGDRYCENCYNIYELGDEN
jgi:hypothetical protein